VHHLVFDGYSMALFFNRVLVQYAAYKNNQPSAVTDETYLYGDFIKDDASYRLSDEFKADSAFWANRLKTYAASKAFQSCMEVGSKKKLSSKRQSLNVSRDLYNQINTFCKGHNCTALHYFIAVVFILNKRYNNDTPTIGIPVFNRRHKKFKIRSERLSIFYPSQLYLNRAALFSTYLFRSKMN
jgi:hypothetical protein